MPINFFKDDVNFKFTNRKKTDIWLRSVVKGYSFSQINLSYIFCSDNALIKINKEFLDHDYYTDVITFDFSSSKRLVGEIYISIDRVKDNAESLETSFERELSRVMVHGLLHMLGYKDASPKEKQEMREVEDKYLAQL